jgi:hypothetical protein
MPEPSLSEITNIRVDPELGTGTPANIIPSSDVVKTLNENAKFKANNDMMRYNNFLGQLSNVFQNGLDIAGTEVRAVDRDYLKNSLASILDPISKDPHAFFSRQGMDDTYAKLIALKSDAQKSKAANIFTQGSREFLNINPSFKDEINTKLVDDSEKAPLSSWQPFQFQYTPHLDLADISKSLYANAGKGDNPFATKFSQFSNDNKFVESGTNYNKEGYLRQWNDKLLNPAVRKSLKTQYYDNLPENVKKTYTNPDGQPNLEALWQHLGEGTFVNDGKIVEKQIANPFELETTRLVNKGKELAIKYGYDKALVNLKQAGILDAIAFRALYKNGAKKDASGKIVPEENFFDDAFDVITTSSVTPDNAVYQTDKSTGQTKLIGYKINTSGNTKKAYGTDKLQTNGQGIESTVRVPAEMVLLSPDGESMISVFNGGYNENEKLIKPDATTNKMSIDEGKAIMKKSVGNVSNIGSASKKSTPVKNYTLNGKTYSDSDVEEAAKASGLSKEKYIKKAGLK